jgi:hypothetical protein
VIDLFDKNEIKQISKYLPVFFTLLGVFKLIVYYGYFDIRIVEYLDFSEVLLSFTDSLVFLLFTIIVPSIILLSFFGKSIGNENKVTYKSQLEFKFWERIVIDFKESKLLCIISIIIILFVLIRCGLHWDTLIYFLMFPGINLIILLVREIRITYWKQYKYSISTTYINVFYILCMVTIITLFFTINEASDVKKRNIYYGTEIQLENENIKSDSITTYIGQTKGYIYLYNKKEKKSISIPRDRVVKLILKRK